MPGSEAARGCVEQMVGDLFTLFCDTRLAPMAARVAWGMVNSFHKVAQQIAREEDSAARELGELARINDPSEIHALEVEEKQRHCQSLHEALAALECMRDHAAEVYRVETGQPWSAVYGSRTSKSLIASQIEARDFLAARAASRREAHAPTGPVVVVSGGAGWQHHEPIWTRLDCIRARIPSMTLVTTAQRSGADAIAAAWAAARGVPTVNFRLNRSLGNRAGFERNKMLIRLSPVEAIICEGSGLQVNLAERCRDAGVPITIMRDRDFAPLARATG
ncbi:MAG TPA: SLOG family protein [Novosphingobium sp.]